MVRHTDRPTLVQRFASEHREIGLNLRLGIILIVALMAGWAGFQIARGFFQANARAPLSASTLTRLQSAPTLSLRTASAGATANELSAPAGVNPPAYAGGNQ